MGKKEDALLAAQLAQINAAIAQMQNPASNPAQQYLTNQALQGAQYFEKGDYSSLPKGMFFDFTMPQEDIAKYKKLSNVGQGGTFALANTGGRTAAQRQAGQYLGDKFARDRMLGYQQDIAGAAQNVRGGLAQAAGAKSGQDSQVMSALQNMYSTTANRPQKPGFNWGGLIGGVLGAI